MSERTTNRFEKIPVLILVGGKGTRLQTVISDRPKPLAPVAGKAFLFHLLDELEAVGFRNFHLLSGYKADIVKEEVGDIYKSARIIHHPEPEPRGTGGALFQAVREIESSEYVVSNGDSFCYIDYNVLARRHQQNNALVTLSVVRVDDAHRYGAIEMSPNGQVLAFQEKGTPGPAWINAGVYWMSTAFFSGQSPGECSLESDLLPRLVPAGKLYACETAGPFIDIGTPESYAAAGEFFRRRR
jgi:NDP-sugar pyrophosphorylase family protein